jgi:hypothetical protein
MALRDPNQTYTYKIFGKNITLPKGFQLAPGVSINQNKKSVEEGFKKLEKWLKNPTPENWNKIFGKNNAFGFQLRNYLLGRNDLGSVKGMPSANAIFDALNVKNLIKATDIKKIDNLTVGGKGVSLRSIGAKTLGNLKFSMADNIETIKNFQNGEAWLRANPDPNKVGPDGKNIYRKYANAIRGMEKESAKIGGFPFGNNSEKKLWAGLYRSSYRGDRIKIVGEFADGNLPINKQGKVDWKMTNKAGVPAWKRVKFVDTALQGQPEFTWDNFKKQVDNVFGKGQFDKITQAYDTQIKTGSKRETSGNYETIKNKTKVNLLRAELLTQEPGRFKAGQFPTEQEYKNYINKRAKFFNITEVHHPDGVGKNPWKMEPVFRYANRELEQKVLQPLKAGNINLDQAKIEIDRINNEVGPIRAKLDDGYYGKNLNTQKSIMSAADNYLDNIKKTPFYKEAIADARRGGPICIPFKAAGGRMGFATGTGCVDEVEEAFNRNPEKLAKDVNKTPGEGSFNKVKNSATKFLTAIKENPNILKGRFGTLAALGVGTVAAGVGAGALVKQFRNDDPNTYLTNDSQMEGMIISDVEQKGEEVDDNILLDNQFKLELAGAAGLTTPIAGQVYRTARQGTLPLLESPLEFDQELKNLKRTIRQITHPGGKKAKRISEAGREVIRNSRLRINELNEIVQSAKAGKEGSGRIMSAIGLNKGVLGKGLWALRCTCNSCAIYNWLHSSRY